MTYDPISGLDGNIDILHKKVNDGVAWELSDNRIIATTGSTQVVRFNISDSGTYCARVLVQGLGTVAFVENPTISTTAGATTLTAYNKNRNKSNLGGTFDAQATVSATTAGTSIVTYTLNSGNGIVYIPDENEPFVLKTNTNYVVKFTSTVGSATNAVSTTVKIYKTGITSSTLA